MESETARELVIEQDAIVGSRVAPHRALNGVVVDASIQLFSCLGFHYAEPKREPANVERNN